MELTIQHQTQLEYTSSEGIIDVLWESGLPIKVAFRDNHQKSFEIETQIPGVPFSLVEPNPQALHKEVILELLLRIPNIRIEQAIYWAKSSGVLDLVIHRSGEEHEIA